MWKSLDYTRQYKRVWASRLENKKKKADYEKRFRAEHPEAIKDYQLRYEYGITLLKYNQILKTQGGKCAFSFCDRKPSKRYFPVDHDHETGRIRGILCDPHNRAIGMFGESHDNLAEIITYLARAM